MESNFSALHTALHERMYLGQASIAISMGAERFPFLSQWWSYSNWGAVTAHGCKSEESLLSNHHQGQQRPRLSSERLCSSKQGGSMNIWQRTCPTFRENRKQLNLSPHAAHREIIQGQLTYIKRTTLPSKKLLNFCKDLLPESRLVFYKFFSYSLTFCAWMLCWSIY